MEFFVGVPDEVVGPRLTFLIVLVLSGLNLDLREDGGFDLVKSVQEPS